MTKDMKSFKQFLYEEVVRDEMQEPELADDNSSWWDLLPVGWEDFASRGSQVYTIPWNYGTSSTDPNDYWYYNPPHLEWGVPPWWDHYGYDHPFGWNTCNGGPCYSYDEQGRPIVLNPWHYPPPGWWVDDYGEYHYEQRPKGMGWTWNEFDKKWERRKGWEEYVYPEEFESEDSPWPEPRPIPWRPGI
jgi:hypothetical protein